MNECVVDGCPDEAVTKISKPTEWSVWEYRVCRRHKDEVDRGAFIRDHPDGRTISLETPRAAEQGVGPASDIDLPLEGGRLVRSDDGLPSPSDPSGERAEDRPDTPRGT